MPEHRKWLLLHLNFGTKYDLSCLQFLPCIGVPLSWLMCTYQICTQWQGETACGAWRLFQQNKQKNDTSFEFQGHYWHLGYLVQLSNLHGCLLCLPTWTTIRVNINFLQQQSNLVLLLKCLLFHFPQALCPCQSNYNKPCCMLLGLSLTKQQPWQAPGMARAGRAYRRN